MTYQSDTTDRDYLLIDSENEGGHKTIPEDKNLARFKNVEELRLSLVRRARASLGMKGFGKAQTMPLNGNALQHAIRMVSVEKPTVDGAIVATEECVARYARHVADETAYWA
jgi:hypothetical protein